LIKTRIEYENDAAKKAIGEWKKNESTYGLMKSHIKYEDEVEKKALGEWEKMIQQMIWPNLI
jgi:hypothetical protein